MGALREAKGGTLFLDEVAELPLELQAALLRALEESSVTPVGSDTPVPTDFRLVTATHKYLLAEARAGRFRIDLYYRVAVLQVAVPPLRERLDELPDIAASILNGFGRYEVAPLALRRLLGHTWPGNIRELRNVLARAVVLIGTRRLIRAEDLMFDAEPHERIVHVDGGAKPQAAWGGPTGASELYRAIRDAGGNKKLAAKRLGIARSTLYEWLKSSHNRAA